MITIEDLQEAIAECQGQRNPNANTCIKLAAYYILADHMKDEGTSTPQYSYDPGPVSDPIVEYDGESEFFKLVNGMEVSDIWPIIDELMLTIKLVHPKLYDGVLRKIKQYP